MAGDTLLPPPPFPKQQQQQQQQQISLINKSRGIYTLKWGWLTWDAKVVVHEVREPGRSYLIQVPYMSFYTCRIKSMSFLLDIVKMTHKHVNNYVDYFSSSNHANSRRQSRSGLEMRSYSETGAVLSFRNLWSIHCHVDACWGRFKFISSCCCLCYSLSDLEMLNWSKTGAVPSLGTL